MFILWPIFEVNNFQLSSWKENSALQNRTVIDIELKWVNNLHRSAHFATHWSYANISLLSSALPVPLRDTHLVRYQLPQRWPPPQLSSCWHLTNVNETAETADNTKKKCQGSLKRFDKLDRTQSASRSQLQFKHFCGKFPGKKNLWNLKKLGQRRSTVPTRVCGFGQFRNKIVLWIIRKLNTKSTATKIWKSIIWCDKLIHFNS